MTFTSLLVFISVYALAVATPGPGIAALIARTLGRGTAGVLPFILGYVVGDLVWFIAAVMGLSVIAKTYAPLFELLKYAGCAYLLYIAVQLWRSEAVLPESTADLPEEKPLSAFLGSLFLTLGNPKVMIFFLSIMPLVVKPDEISFAMGLELALTIAIVISSILLGYVLLAARAEAVPLEIRPISLAKNQCWRARGSGDCDRLAMKSGFVIAAGLFDLAIAVFHILFWRLFNWPESLKGSGRLNMAITQTLNIMLTYVFVVYGLALLIQGAASSALLLLAGAAFGVLRIALQFQLFGVKSRASIAFVAAAAFGTILHLIASIIGG